MSLWYVDPAVQCVKGIEGILMRTSDKQLAMKSWYMIGL